jgi:regulator of protease activity HflC (stomatin/prohibitin superfamily)
MRKKNKMEETDILKKIVGIAGPIIVLFILLTGTFYIIPAGERGVLLTFGKPNMNAVGEGLHIKIPLVQKIVKMDIKTQKYEAPASAASSDLQIVNSVIATNYHLVGTDVPRLYQEIGLDYATKVIMPLEQEVVKSITAKFTAEQLVTKREEVRIEIKSLLTERLAARGIIVEEVSIVNFDFSPEFNKAIENKVTQEQNAMAAKNKLAQIEYEAQQAVTAAKGQADSQALLAKSVNVVTLEYQALLNQKSAIDKWDGRLPTFVSGGNMPFIGNIGNLGNSSI